LPVTVFKMHVTNDIVIISFAETQYAQGFHLTCANRRNKGVILYKKNANSENRRL
jgi:hypothetical protein